MTAQITYPQDPTLRKIIQYFIFIKKESNDAISQTCYPNTNHCLSLMRGSRLVRTSEVHYTVTRAAQNTSYVTGIYQTPIVISSNIAYEEVCINFNPLGLEAVFHAGMSSHEFKDNVLASVSSSHAHALDEIAFSQQRIEDIQAEMESFLLELIPDTHWVAQVEQLNAIHPLTTMEELEDVLCKSYRSTHRYFTSQLGITPKDFMLIKKVRAAMQALVQHESISEASDHADFSDASHFVRTFKKYACQTPSDFKKRASVLHDTLIWSLD